MSRRNPDSIRRANSTTDRSIFRPCLHRSGVLPLFAQMQEMMALRSFRDFRLSHSDFLASQGYGSTRGHKATKPGYQMRSIRSFHPATLRFRENRSPMSQPAIFLADPPRMRRISPEGPRPFPPCVIRGGKGRGPALRQTTTAHNAHSRLLPSKSDARTILRQPSCGASDNGIRRPPRTRCP